MNTSVLQLDPQTAESLYGSSNINIQVGLSGSLLLLCGLQLSFFGFRCFRTTLAVVGFLILGSLTWIGLVNNKPMDGYSRDAITMFMVPLCIGIVGALVGFYFWKLSVGLIALLGGLTLALFICCWRDDLVIPSEQGRIGFFIGCPLVMLILSKWKEKAIVLFSLSFAGAFSFILGIDLLAHTGYVTAYWHMLAPTAPNNSPFVITRLMYIMQCATLFVFLVSFLWQIIVHYHDPVFGVPKPPTPPPTDIEQPEPTTIPQRYSSLPVPPSPPFRQRPHTISSVSVSPTPTQLENHQTPPTSTTQLPMTSTSPLAHPMPSSARSQISESPSSSSDESRRHQHPSSPLSYPSRSVRTL